MSLSACSHRQWLPAAARKVELVGAQRKLVWRRMYSKICAARSGLRRLAIAEIKRPGLGVR